MLEYGTNNIKVDVNVDGWAVVSGTLNIVGYNKLSDFMERDVSKFIKLVDANRGARYYKFIMINKDKIVGVYESN